MKWRYPKVSIRTFIDDPYYLGIGAETYPKIKDMCEQIVEGKYTEGVEVAGIGSGKSYSSEILACYSAHHLLCLRNAHHYYNLSPDKAITIMNMGITATQANEIVFAGVRSFIERSPFFMQFNPNMLAGSVRFQQEKVLMISGNSKATTPLGHNIFTAILDEAAFYLDTDNHSLAEEIYSALQRRIVSRFGNDGLIMMISSPKYVGDFIMRKLLEEKLSSKVFGVQLPTWKIKPVNVMEEGSNFYFHKNTHDIQDEKPDIEDRDIDLITNKGFNGEAEWWEIPGDFRQSFDTNPEKSKRDFGATPSLALEAFDKTGYKVKTNFNPARVHPVDKANKFSPDFQCAVDDQELRYIHIDLALTKDACGIAMGCFNGYDTSGKERGLKVKIDLMMQIKATKGGEIQFSGVRDIIYALDELGFDIAKITYDGWQCIRKGTKIPVITLDSSQSIIYNGNINTKLKDMPLNAKASIPLLSGEDKNIEDIKEGEYVYSINKHGDIGFGRVKKAWCSGNKKLLRIHLDNKEFIDCSEKHPFMLRDGSYKQARYLEEGDSLMPLYRRKGMSDLPDYEMVLHPRGKWEYTHRAIMRQKNELRRGRITHHRNAIKKDNRPTNLKSLSPEEHSKGHRENGIRGFRIARERLANNPEAQEKRNKALAETSKRNWKNNPEKMSTALARGNKERWLKEEEHKKMSKFIAERNSKDNFRTGTRLKENTKKSISETMKEWWDNPDNRKKQSEAHKGNKGFWKGKKHSKETIEKIKATKLRKNHKVLRIEILNIEDEVWDIEVEGTHNFATSAGVFVHNSVDSRQILEDKGYETDLLSVDRTTEAYDTLKELLHTNRLDYYHFETFEKEYECLELIKGKKVDHPSEGSKDVSDAVAGVCLNVINAEEDEFEPEAFYA